MNCVGKGSTENTLLDRHQREPEEVAALRRELQARFSLIIGGSKPSQIVELVNERTGEKYYTRVNQER